MVTPEGSPRAHRSVRNRVVDLDGRRPFERTSVIDGLVAEFKGKIASGELKDGDMLASQDELARTMGVSRTSLREALIRLSLMGLIEMRHGSGTFVRVTRPQAFMNSLSSLLIMDRASAAELLQARFHVESAVAALAASNATGEDIDLLRSLVDLMEKHHSVGNNDDFVALDTQFHMAIAESSKNRVLMKVVEIMREILPPCIRRFHMTYPERVPTTLGYHRAICEAIAHHDPVEARRNMEGHVGFLMQLNEESEAATAHDKRESQ